MPYADGEFYDESFKLSIWGFDDFPLSVLKFFNLSKIASLDDEKYFSNLNSFIDECNNLFNREFTYFEEVERFCDTLSKVTDKCINVHMFQDSEY